MTRVTFRLGFLLSRYRSGRLLKLFGILPNLPPSDVLRYLEIKAPEYWTPHAVFAATRVLMSADSRLIQDFLTSILLPRIRNDISEQRRLSVHFYHALRKGLQRHVPFFKGLVFPLLGAGCTLREATIISSVLKKAKIPVLHSAAAICRMCEISRIRLGNRNDSDDHTSLKIFIRALIEKRYALPFQTLDVLVFYFWRLRNIDWTVSLHQCLLILLRHIGARSMRISENCCWACCFFSHTLRSHQTFGGNC